MYDETEETYCSSEHIVSEKTGRLQALVWYGGACVAALLHSRG